MLLKSHNINMIHKSRHVSTSTIFVNLILLLLLFLFPVTALLLQVIIPQNSVVVLLKDNQVVALTHGTGGGALGGDLLSLLGNNVKCKI